MKLTTNEIFNISLGATRVQEVDNGIVLCRFTQEQAKVYEKDNPGFYAKSFSSAGVKLCFKTNSEKLGIKFSIDNEGLSTRMYFAIDLFINGKFSDSINNFENAPVPENYPFAEFEVGNFFKEFNLGDGNKEVTVHLPCLVRTVIEEITVDDGAKIEAIKPSKTLIAYGDSITHGYDSLHPSNRYPAILTEKLDAQEFNKGIGGEVFRPALAKVPDGFVPDYVTVAYGTNDWVLKDRETFVKECREFYKALSDNYKTSKIFAISPIWRADKDEERNFGLFSDISEEIKKAVADLENVTYVEGGDLVPQDPKYFADFRLHPNDEGFKYYAENLYNKIKDALK